MHDLRCYVSVRESLKPLCFLLVFLFFRITKADFKLNTISFNEGYSPLFGHDNGNLVHSPDDTNVKLLLDRFTGSGFISSSMYNHGFFSTKIKLPGDYTAGLVVAFYTSNADVFEKTHDELDFEFLGNIPGKPWRFQTNLYGNGSTHRGREERYRLWFDPSKDFHRYSILWTSNTIIFYIDDVPVREIKRNPEMGIEFPSKPMSIYATIWDASSWATDGGKYKLNYKYAPFVAEFKEFALDGCLVDPIQEFPGESCLNKDIELEDKDYATMTLRQRDLMMKFRHKYMYYSYCYDTLRYPVPPPECVVDTSLRARFKDTGRLNFGGSHKETGHRRRGRRHGRSRNNEADMSH